MAFGKPDHHAGDCPAAAWRSTSAGRPPAACSNTCASGAAMPCSTNHAKACDCSGQTMVCPRQRLRMVGSNWCEASVAKTNLTSPGGSSRVLSRALAVTWFMRSAGKTSTALPRPRALVRCENSTASRMASTRISLEGLRLFLSISSWAFSLKGQPNSSITVSGISTHRSAWVRTAMAWQLPQTPQAPCAVGCSHNHALATAKASSYWPKPEGPANIQAWPFWASSCSVCAAIQGAFKVELMMKAPELAAQPVNSTPRFPPPATPLHALGWR